MNSKATVIIFLTAFLSAQAAELRSKRGVAAVLEAEPVDLNPQYAYSYSIHDALTGDAKTHSESRNGENIQGEYSVVDPDGTLRVVTYTAGKEGFNAVINRQLGYAAAAPVAIRKQPLVYAPQYAAQQVPASTIAVQAVARPLAIRKRVVHKRIPAIGFPAFQNQLVSHPPIQFVQQLPQPVQVPIQEAPVVQPQPPVQVVQQQEPAPIPVQQPQPVIPVQEQFQQQEVPAFPQPQPAPIQQQPPQFPQPAPIQQQPPQFPQPAPVQQQPPQFPQPTPIQQQPPSFPQPAPPQQAQFDDSDTVEVVAAPRSSNTANIGRPGTFSRAAGPSDGSAFSYSSSRGNQYDFRVAY